MALAEAEERVRRTNEQVREAVTEANKQVKEANERTKDAIERTEAAESKLRPTTFLDYLNKLQTIVDPSLVIETDSSARSSESVTDVTNKFYPRILRHWAEFPSLHERFRVISYQDCSNCRSVFEFVNIQDNFIPSEVR